MLQALDDCDRVIHTACTAIQICQRSLAAVLHKRSLSGASKHLLRLLEVVPLHGHSSDCHGGAGEIGGDGERFGCLRGGSIVVTRVEMLPGSDCPQHG